MTTSQDSPFLCQSRPKLPLLGSKRGGRWTFQAEDNAALIRFRPLLTVSASLTTFGSSEGCSTVHSQNDAINEARSMESFDASKPDSMIGIRAAAALRRLISGDGGGIWFDMPVF